MKKFPLVLALLLSVGIALPAAAEGYVDPAEKEAIIETLKEVIKESASGKVADVDASVSKLNGVVEKGKGIAAAFAAKHPDDKKALDFVVANIDDMKKETLETIEPNWHEGKKIKDAGAGDYAKIDQTGATAAAMDLIIHPVTAIICLETYKKDQNKEHLDQVVSELEELVGHMGHL